MEGRRFGRALASCWRVSLLLTAGLILLGGWLYWQSPTLDSLRPTIETHLQEKLQLQKVQLGKLSWSWSGFLWLESDQLAFSSQDGAIGYRDGSVAVRINPSDLISGSFRPDQIRLHGGQLHLQHTPSEQHTLPPAELMLDDVNLSWRFDERWHGSIPKLKLLLNGAERELIASSPQFSLSARLDQAMRPQSIDFFTANSAWLPEAAHQYLKGHAALLLKLKRLDQSSWDITASIQSDQKLTIMPDTIYSADLHRAELEIMAHLKPGTALSLELINFKRAHWALDENAITASGKWHAGLLTLDATSDHLAMPVVWSWLRPLGDEQWHHWLSLMQHGIASGAKATVSLAWDDPLRAMPPLKNWEAMLFHVTAEVNSADIALGLSDDFMRNAKAFVDLNEHGLNAEIADALLPRELGHVTGALYIPWQTLELHINGRSRVDVASLINWFGPSQITDWKWNGARADSTFQLIWDPSKPKPDEAIAQLKPAGSWNASIYGTDLELLGGSAQWDQDSGLKLDRMRFRNPHIDGILSLNTAIDDDNNWRIKSFETSSKSDFALLAAHFQLPLAQAAGEVQSSLKFDQTLTGSIDLSGTSWKQLLGSSKESGEQYQIDYRGTLDIESNKPEIRIKSMASNGKALLIRDGTASINAEKLTLILRDLHTPSFSGGIDIRIPFSDKPWQLIVDADYLNRNALPASLDHPAQMVDKSWMLAANLKRFDWDDARMQGVSVRFASAQGSVGTFRADNVHANQLDITDMDGRFSMPGQGEVDLRRLSANIEGQQLLMSARLTPEAGGGMRWRGFSELHGDFGNLLKLGKISERFMEGESHILFSGSGIILREQPWWQGLDGRLRLRSDKGRILEGGALTKLLAATNLTKLPMLLIGQRDDLSGPGTMYERLQMEAIMQNQQIRIRNVAMRSAAFDLAGHGSMDIEKNSIDVFAVVRPLQNLDALLAKIPLLRDILGGSSHSLIRKVYRLHGPFSDAKVETVHPKTAGLSSPGLIEGLLTLPNLWFSPEKDTKPASP